MQDKITPAETREYQRCNDTIHQFRDSCLQMSDDVFAYTMDQMTGALADLDFTQSEIESVVGTLRRTRAQHNFDTN